MLDILKECEINDLYLDNDATGEAYTSDFICVAQVFRYCLQNDLSTDWDLPALRGSRDKIGKLLSNLKISTSEAKKIWKIQPDVSDQRSLYKCFEDVNAFLVGGV